MSGYGTYTEIFQASFVIFLVCWSGVSSVLHEAVIELIDVDVDEFSQSLYTMYNGCRASICLVAWVSNPRSDKFNFAARGHVRKLCIYYKITM